MESSSADKYSILVMSRETSKCGLRMYDGRKQRANGKRVRDKPLVNSNSMKFDCHWHIHCAWSMEMRHDTLYWLHLAVHALPY